MTAMKVYLRLYAECFRKAFAAIGKSPWTLLLPSLVLLARAWAAPLAYRLGMLGGIVMTLITAALFSSYLHFAGELVRRECISGRDFQRSFAAYLWPVVNVFFVVWMGSLVLGLVIGNTPNAAALIYAIELVAVVALNAVPEVVYLRESHGGMQTITVNWGFLKEQWIPWFAPNVPLLGAVLLIAASVQTPIVGTLLLGAALHVAMVFRGNLFRALDRTSHRQRMFAQRMGSGAKD